MTNTTLMFHLREDTKRYNRITGAHFDRAYVIPKRDVLEPHKFSGRIVAVAHDPKTDLWMFFGDITYSRKTEHEIKRLAESFGYTFPSDALPVKGRTARADRF